MPLGCWRVMEVYAYQAKDKELVAFAAEMKRRAERRETDLCSMSSKHGSSVSADAQETR